MTAFDYDLISIGAGSGGVRASRLSAQFGARVAIVEKQYLGGTCVNVGCVPKKLMSYASNFSDEFKYAKGFGWEIESKPKFDWHAFIENKNSEITRLNGIYENLLTKAGVDILWGHGKLVDRHTVEVNGKTYTAKHILLVSGSTPVKPDAPGCELGITSNEAFFLDKFPKRIIIAGAGYIASEFACIFAGMGSHVTQVHRGDLVLRGFDHEIRQLLTDEIAKKVDLKLHTTIDKVEKVETGLLATLSDGSQVEADQVMAAIGRIPNTTNLGLENVGVELDNKGAIIVNEHYQTNIDNIFAIGDVINRVTLTPVALNEGIVVAKSLFDTPPQPLDYENIPTAVFTNPTLGTVGLTEEQAKERYENIDIYTSDFRSMKIAFANEQQRTFMKLVVDADTDRVLGCHMLGPDAPEIIQGLGVVVKAQGTKAHFDATIGIHPTAAEEFVTMREKTR